MALLVVLLVLIAVPALEIYVFVVISDAVGFLNTVALVLATSALGIVLVRAQGRAAMQRFLTAIAERRPPAREALDGALVLLGGLLLIVPGFITDVLGVLLLAPPSRAIVRRLVARHYSARVLRWFARSSGPSPGYDVEGQVIDIDAQELHP